MNIQHAFQEAINNNDTVNFNFLLSNHKKDIDFSYWNNHAIRLVSSCGYLDIFKVLIKDNKVDPTLCTQFCIRGAFKYSHYEIAKQLLKFKKVDPTILNNICINYSVDNNNIKMVELLLNERQISEKEGYTKALTKSYVLNNNKKMFELLFKNLNKSIKYDISELFDFAMKNQDFYLINKIFSCKMVNTSNVSNKFKCTISL